MLGMRGGVATLLKKEVPFMIANHCIAHRLALACGQASDEVPYIKKFKAILDQLYRFYDNSPVRTAGLHSIQEILNEPNLKLCQAKDVRWLSHEKAINNLRQCLQVFNERQRKELVLMCMVWQNLYASMNSLLHSTHSQMFFHL